MGKNNPLTFAILNMVVGLLVAKGLVPGEHQDEIVTMISEIVGYGIVLATAIVSLYHFIQSHKIGTITIPLDPPPTPVLPVAPVEPVSTVPVAIDLNTVGNTPIPVDEVAPI
jgi:hypothetical protein